MKYGKRAICKFCGQEIEYHGINGWLDRGGNRACASYVDKKAGEVIRPKKNQKHKP